MSKRAFDPSKTPGAIGEAPPPGAPIETTMPLSAELLQQQADRAARNEKTLAPIDFTPADPTKPAVVIPAPSTTGGGKNVGGVMSNRKLRAPGAPLPAGGSPIVSPSNTLPPTRVASQRPSGVTTDAEAVSIDSIESPDGAPLIVLTDAADAKGSGQPAEAADRVEPELAPPPAIRPDRPAGKLADAVRSQLDARQRLAQPAASNSDSPARGVPRPIDDPNKKISGGFGEAANAQYFPLDGNELRELVLSLLDALVATLQHDLRFSIAAVYPRVAVTAEIRVNGFIADADFAITKIAPPHTKTPIEVARARADEGVFVVVATRQEMTPDGESISPPNAVRAELGLPIPAKQSIEVPGGRMIVDRLQ